MNKIVIILNGKGGSGKDTISNIIGDMIGTYHISAIDIIKTIASTWCGWDESKKTKKDRKFLSDLKNLLIDYSDIPFKYLIEHYEIFKNSTDKYVMIIDIREPNEIKKMVEYVSNDKYMKCITLLISRESTNYQFDNTADDGVVDYDYDFTYYNNGKLEDLDTEFSRWYLETILPLQLK